MSKQLPYLKHCVLGLFSNDFFFNTVISETVMAVSIFANVHYFALLNIKLEQQFFTP